MGILYTLIWTSRAQRLSSTRVYPPCPPTPHEPSQGPRTRARRIHSLNVMTKRRLHRKARTDAWPLWQWVAMAGISIAVVSCQPSSKDTGGAIQDRSALADATKITFIQNSFGGTNSTLSFTDTDEVRLLLSAIQLQKKEPCACAHVNLAVFHKLGGEVRVSFCEYCFDVLTDTNLDAYHARALHIRRRFTWNF